MPIRWSHAAAGASVFALFALASPAQAQSTSMTVDGTTVAVGGGIEWIDLPAFGATRNRRLNETGGAFSGEIASGIGHWGGSPVTGAVRGFFASVEDGSRDADLWGIAAEARFGAGQPAPPASLYRNDYFLFGADVRGIDQDAPGERLDTTYVGGYIGIGGEYNVLGLLGIGIMDRWGLRSFATARAGIYGADADYRGAVGFSDDEVAFIGSLSFETRKQLGPRTSLSLITDYEYYAWVPEVRYVGGAPTGIADDDAWGVRSVLRLNIGLGPKALYAEPVK